MFKGQSFQCIASACVHMCAQVAFRVCFFGSLGSVSKRHLQKLMYAHKCQMCTQHLSHFDSKQQLIQTMHYRELILS